MKQGSEPFVGVQDLSKVFALAEVGGGPVSLVKALRSGRSETTTRQVRALEGVTFAIREGERVGIIGRNGAGKTTLLSLLAGITEPTSGTITVTGDVHAMLTIGAVLRDEATGRENIYLDGAVHGKSREEVDVRIEEVIAFSELGDFIDRPVRTYSSGMKARLAFSMGAFIDPDILIIDETLSVGDVFFAAKASRRMKEIAAQGRIVIVVSHSLGTIVEMCERCLWLDQGRLIMDGPAAAVTKAYEQAVEQADEAELAAKFDRGGAMVRLQEHGSITDFYAEQEGIRLGATARAFVPLQLNAQGTLARGSESADLNLSILRVDGRRIFARALSQTGSSMPGEGPFRAVIEFDPLLLAAGLYRFDITLSDASGSIDAASRVVEIIDEEGQFGGQPMLYHPPIITAVRTGDLE
jgi:lipopolysaccharide transport system ATP-binding protein